MSLEQAVNECTSALRELMSRFPEKGGTPTAVVADAADTTSGKRGPGRPKTTAAAAVTLDMVKAAANKLGEEKGKPAARELIQAHGAKSTTEMDPAKYTSFIAAVDVALRAAPDEDVGEAEDDVL